MRTTVLFSAAACLLAGSAFAQPANDSCSSPQAITGFGQTAIDNTNADTDGPEVSCALCNHDVWFVWTATETGTVQMDMCTGTGFDTVLVVYNGTACPTGGDELVCDDDTCSNRSQVQFDAVAGQQYLVRLGGYFDFSVGTGTLTIGVPPPPPPPNVIAGPFHNDANGHDYYLLESSSWHDAETFAVGLGGHLATIRNEDENLFVYNNVMRYDGNPIRRGWIGLNDEASEGNYVWTSGEPVTYTNWGSGEPNHANGTEFYAQIPYWQIQWNDNSDFPLDDACYGIAEIITTPPSCPADLGTAGGLPGQDGLLNNNDFISFITYFFNSDSHADVGIAGGLNGSDGLYNNNDFIAFINLFFDGCGA